MKLMICVLVSGFVAACAVEPTSDTAGSDQVSTAESSLVTASAPVILDAKSSDTPEHIHQALVALSASACHTPSNHCTGLALNPTTVDCGPTACSLNGCPIINDVLRTHLKQPREVVHPFQLANGTICADYSSAPYRLLGCGCLVDDQ